MHIRTFLGVTIAVLVLTVALGSDASATGPIGVRYQWSGQVGQLEIDSAPGLDYTARDANGVVVASGQTTGGVMSLSPVSNAGFSSQGWILRVDVDGVLFATTDPDWDWN